MPRFTRLAWPLFLGAFSGVVAIWSGCGDADIDVHGANADASAPRRDASPVDPSEPGPPADGGLLSPPSCERYCALVTTHCTGPDAQYASVDECSALCPHLPPGDPIRGDGEKAAATLACRQYWADAPARTDPASYCLAAGPFGGNTCGDRCTAFCDVLLSTCATDGGAPTYESRDACRNNCKFFAYRDAGEDGGGENPAGPTEGDSFNCRLYWLRAATMDAGRCAALGPDGDACEN